MKPLKILIFLLLCFWLIACAQTPSPTPPKPEPEESAEKTSESKSESKAQEARKQPQEGQAAGQDEKEKVQKEVDKTDSKGQADSREASEPEVQKTGEQSQTGRTASQKPSGAKQKKPEIGGEDGRTSAPDTANARLEEARKNLRLSEATEKRIASELEQLKKSGNASPEAVRDYEAYLESVQAMTAENRRIVEQMEATYARKASEENRSKNLSTDAKGNMTDPDISEAQTSDEVAELDRKLNASLANFDDMLLKEMDSIRAESAEKMKDLARDAAEAAKRLREKGLDVDTSESESTEKNDDQERRSDSGENTEAAEDAQSSETASSGQAGKGGQGPSKDKERRADYEDDDIVARQLREAAENETDPELKEKLWKEYEEYKKSL